MINSTNWNLPPEFTVSVWFNFTANAGTENPRVLSAAGWEIGTQTTAASRKVFFDNTTASAGAFGLDSTNTFPAGTWIHAVGVRNANQLVLYVNGAFAGSVSVPQFPDYSRGLPEMGGNFLNGYDAFAGAVDDVRIYNRAFSAAEIQQLHAFESVPPAISLTENLWPNPSLEADSNGDGTPDFWNKGGTDLSLNVWTTNTFSSGSHSLAVWDTNTVEHGGWFSDNLSVTPGERYVLRFKRSYCADGGGMRVSLRYSSLSNTYVSGISFPVSGCQLQWEEFTSVFVVPTGIGFVNLEIVSGGAASVVGTNWIDDISLAALWPNPSMELDSDGNGTPDFWNRGGSNQALDFWTTNSSVSPNHSLAILDDSTQDYGQWYSDMVRVAPGERYTLSYKRRYCGAGPVGYDPNWSGRLAVIVPMWDADDQLHSVHGRYLEQAG